MMMLPSPPADRAAIDAAAARRWNRDRSRSTERRSERRREQIKRIWRRLQVEVGFQCGARPVRTSTRSDDS